MDGNLYRGWSLQRRVPSCLRALKVRSEQQARTLLEERPDLLSAAVDAILIGTTSFFRDRDVFERFRETALPELARLGDPLRVWCAGCSTGGEVYTMALLLAKARLLDRSFLLGSDCRVQAVACGRAALYESSALESMEPALRSEYFKSAGDCWRPVSSLRERVHWRTADLARRIEPGPWDVILWRNMAIYLNPEPAAALWRRLAGELRPGGYLVVGRAERPPAELELQQAGRQIYRKKTL